MVGCWEWAGLGGWKDVWVAGGSSVAHRIVWSVGLAHTEPILSSISLERVHSWDKFQKTHSHRIGTKVAFGKKGHTYILKSVDLQKLFFKRKNWCCIPPQDWKERRFWQGGCIYWIYRFGEAVFLNIAKAFTPQDWPEGWFWQTGHIYWSQSLWRGCVFWLNIARSPIPQDLPECWFWHTGHIC